MEQSLMDVDAPVPPIQPEEGEPLISLHALTGEAAIETLKVAGRVGKHQILILIDSGSSHNFMDSELAEKLSWWMQGKEFSADTLVMPLAEYDLILGVKWLKPLGPILWDFQNQFMQFEWQGQPFMLDLAPRPKLSWIDSKKMLHTLL